MVRKVERSAISVTEGLSVAVGVVGDGDTVISSGVMNERDRISVRAERSTAQQQAALGIEKHVTKRITPGAVVAGVVDLVENH